MKKILFIIDTLNGGGAEKILINILKELDRRKFEIELLVINEEGVYLDQVPKDIKLNFIFKKNSNKYLKNISKFYLPLLTYLSNKILDKQYDIEISFLESYGSYIISKRKALKKITWIHIDLKKVPVKNFLKKIPYYFIGRSFEKMDEIITVSEDAKKSFVELFPETLNKVKVIYNPINLNEIKNKALEAIEIKEDVNEFSDKIPVFISMGRLTGQKGYDRLICAVSRLKSEDKKFKVLILGEGPLKEELQNKILETASEEYIKIIGFKTNPYKYIKKSNCYILSSRFEALPTVLIEALALEKNIISTKVAGAEEIIGEYENGYICENSEEGIYQAMKLYLENNLKFDGEKNSKEIEIRFDKNRKMNEIEELFLK